MSQIIPKRIRILRFLQFEIRSSIRNNYSGQGFRSSGQIGFASELVRFDLDPIIGR